MGFGCTTYTYSPNSLASTQCAHARYSRAGHRAVSAAGFDTNFTCHRKQNYRTWWPLFYCLIDVAYVNAYPLWKWSSTANSARDSKTPNGHRVHERSLYSITSFKRRNLGVRREASHPPLNKVLSCNHKPIYLKSFGRCEWGKLHSLDCSRKRSFIKRKFGTDITESIVNNVSETWLGGSRTYCECSECQIWLCIEGRCWERYHHSIGV